MTNYTISNESEWNTVAGNTISASDTITLTSDFTFTSNPTPIILGTALFDGGGYTITYDVSQTTSLFSCKGGTVRSLTVNGGGATMDQYEGGVLSYDAGGFRQYGNFINIHVSNMTILDAGGITSYLAGDNGSSKTTYIYKCSSSVIVNGSFAGGIVGVSKMQLLNIVFFLELFTHHLQFVEVLLGTVTVILSKLDRRL